MGGTFDPLHHGHLVAASEVADRFDLQRVIFCPSGAPWHKTTPTTSAEDRYLMTVIATAADPRFEVSRVDIDRDGPTYTVDTLRDLHEGFARAHPHDSAEWFFITGADAIAAVLSWKEGPELTSLAHFVGVSRPGHDLRVDSLPSEHVTVLEVPALAISSSDCRARVAEGNSVWYLGPDGVVQYIAKHRLYRDLT